MRLCLLQTLIFSPKINSKLAYLPQNGNMSFERYFNYFQKGPIQIKPQIRKTCIMNSKLEAFNGHQWWTLLQLQFWKFGIPICTHKFIQTYGI